MTLRLRITPTCVGKRGLDLALTEDNWDHPHMCGEKLYQRLEFCSLAGSPPHVWGKVVHSECSGIAERITPTCVGKRNTPPQKYKGNRDHPHMCGEKAIYLNPLILTPGSPPRVWGKALK